MDFITQLEALVASLKEAAKTSATQPLPTTAVQPPTADPPTTADTTLLNSGLSAQEIAALKALVVAQAANTPPQPVVVQEAKPILAPTPATSPQPSSVSFTPAQAALFLAQYSA